MSKINLKKLLILNIPYILVGLFATNFGEAWRLAEGADSSAKILSFFYALPIALGNPLPSFYPLDLLVGIACGAANIGQIPNLEKLVATIRSREISACLVLQAQSQLKAIYKDNSDTIIGNMDSRIFLGGSEPTTLKELNQALGKETIDTYNTSNTRGNSPSYGMNYQKLGKDLATVDELAVLDGGKCILQLRGVRPFLSDKYDLTQHPNYKYTSDFDKKNEFNIEQFLSRRLKLKAGDEFVVVDAD